MIKEKAIEVLRDIATEIDDFCYGAKHWRDKDKEEIEALDMAIKALKGQPKEGEWIEDEYGIPHCSKCNCINNTVYRNYCPNCGAKMFAKDINVPNKKGAEDEA